MTALTTKAQVKAWFSPPLTVTTDDALIDRIILAASAFIEREVGRQFGSASHAAILDGTGGTRLLLPNTPVTAVSSVAVDGVAVPASTGAPQPGFLFDADSITLLGYRFSRGSSNVRIVYTAGYATTPDDIEQACIELVALRYRERQRIGQASATLGGETVTFIAKEMPESVRGALDNYRRVACT